MAQKPKTVIFPTFLLENLFMTVVAGGTVTLNIPAIYEGLLLMRLTKNDEKVHVASSKNMPNVRLEGSIILYL